MRSLTHKEIGKICRGILLDHLENEWGPLSLEKSYLISHRDNRKILVRYARFIKDRWFYDVKEEDWKNWEQYTYLALLMREDNKLNYVLLNPKESKEILERISPASSDNAKKFNVYLSARGKIYIQEWPDFPIEQRITFLDEISLESMGTLPPLNKYKSTKSPVTPAASPAVIRRQRVSSPIERHRLLLQHLANFGEITPAEEERLGINSADRAAWLESLLLMRPTTKVASPLFFWATEGNASSGFFITRLAIKILGDTLAQAISQPIDSLEEYVWEKFRSWHLPQPHSDDHNWHSYLSFPIAEAPHMMASERLDLFAHFPPTIISELLRNPGFTSEQQEWSAKASSKSDLGPLSSQIKKAIRRPLLLSQFQLPEFGGGSEIHLQSLKESEVIRRHYVISGLPLCTHEEWQKDIRLTRKEIARRILDHPLYALIVQFEVFRFMASISGETASQLIQDHSGNTHLEVSGNRDVPLWQTCRSLLTDLGFWPVTWSANASYWEKAVQQALMNLENLLVFERIGDRLCLTEAFSSEIRAHPGCPQNRGEKEFRIRLGKYLESLG